MKVREAVDAFFSGEMAWDEFATFVANLPQPENPAPWNDEVDTEGTLFELSEIAWAENFSSEEYASFMDLMRQALKEGKSSGESGEDGPDFSAPVEVAKADEYKNLVFGWASVAFSKDGTQILDRQGHAIDVEDLEEAAYNFTLHSYGSGDMHKSEGFGELVESMVFTDEKLELLGLEKGSVPQAWWVGFKVPPEYHQQVREGKRTMFSIEGTAKLEPY